MKWNGQRDAHTSVGYTSMINSESYGQLNAHTSVGYASVIMSES